ncbi:MAG: DUF1573 domain-containing protein [Dysgonamonadaceae bacterium]|jgi:hypothetical protein|nr:DUF1573 domain-containing protein [Dysgonamonadaceae bacterium]
MLKKKVLKYALLTFVCAANVAATGEEQVTVDKTIHDFGAIKGNKSVKAVFTVKNKTKVPILLSEVRASCGCTTPDWTREPIAPGKTGKVTAVYNPKGNVGPFEKSVTINVSVGDKVRTIVVKVKGTVKGS